MEHALHILHYTLNSAVGVRLYSYLFRQVRVSTLHDVKPHSFQRFCIIGNSFRI